jgi:hypothetical protein
LNNNSLRLFQPITLFLNISLSQIIFFWISQKMFHFPLEKQTLWKFQHVFKLYNFCWTCYSTQQMDEITIAKQLESILDKNNCHEYWNVHFHPFNQRLQYHWTNVKPSWYLMLTSGLLTKWRSHIMACNLGLNNQLGHWDPHNTWLWSHIYHYHLYFACNG